MKSKYSIIMKIITSEVDLYLFLQRRFWGVDVNLVRISSCASYASDSIDHKDKVGRGADWDGDWGETGVSARGMLRFFKLAKNEIHVF